MTILFAAALGLSNDSTYPEELIDRWAAETEGRLQFLSDEISVWAGRAFRALEGHNSSREATPGEERWCDPYYDPQEQRGRRCPSVSAGLRCVRHEGHKEREGNWHRYTLSGSGRSIGWP